MNFEIVLAIKTNLAILAKINLSYANPLNLDHLYPTESKCKYVWIEKKTRRKQTDKWHKKSGAKLLRRPRYYLPLDGVLQIPNLSSLGILGTGPDYFPTQEP